MRISVNWLKELVDFDVPVDELARIMTLLGMEVESIDRPGDDVEGVVVGRVLEIHPHPNADKLSVCKTDVGGESALQIVCGAKNFNVGDKVPTAVVGSTLPGGFKIGARKMRGEQSQGMMCSARELGLGEDHDGLLVLPSDFEVGADVRPLLGLDDCIIEIEVTPNRGDWAGMIGIARDLAAYFGKAINWPDVTVTEGGFKAESLSSVTIEAPDLCPRYCGRVLQGAAIGPSPQWLTKRLIAAGQRPINNIVDITNYVLIETGHPLHAFDLHRLAEERIVVRRAKAGERITTIDEVEHTLDDSMLVIADAERPVALAGIMGGADSEVHAGTTDIFLESAYFEPKSIRKTARATGKVTEASQRFQRGADPNIVRFALDRAAQLMHDVAGAKIGEGILDASPGDFEPRQVTLQFENCSRLLGDSIASDKQIQILEKTGFKKLSGQNGEAVFAVPSWRPDITLEADLIEDIARFHGYDTIPVALPRVRRTEAVLAPHDKPARELRRHLAGIGLNQFMSLAFIAEAELEVLGMQELREKTVALQNPLSEKFALMRPSVLPSMLAAVARNIRHGNTDVRAFEVGHVYRQADPNAELPDQYLHLAIVLSGQAEPANWSRDERTVDFYDLKGYLESAFDFLNIGGVNFRETEAAPFQAGQAGDIYVGDRKIGSLGEVRGDVGRALDVDQPIFAAEIGLESVLDGAHHIAAFQAVPAYPATGRDVAVLVDRSVTAQALVDAAAKVGGKDLRDIELIDVYWGKPIPAGKKSVALRLTYQSADRTLTDKDTEKSWKKVVRALEQECGAQLR